MIPRSIYIEEHDMFRDSVRKFMEKEIQPHWEEWEAQGHISREAWLKAGETGLLCTHLPEEYGGSGVDFRYSAIVIEERSEEHTSELQSRPHLVCRLLLEKKKKKIT